MMNISYCRIMESLGSQLIADAREEMVKYALEHGIKPTAREFGISPHTVRKWKKRYKEKGKEGLYDQSKRPNSSPRKMSYYWRMKLLTEARKEIMRLTRLRVTKSKPIVLQATWLKREFKIPYSIPTILKVLHEAGLKKITPQKKKSSGDRTVQERKQALLPFSLVQVDIKYLTDIHGYSRYARGKHLPQYQITFRDVATGALFVALSQDKSTTATAIAVDMFCEHLTQCGIDCSTVTFQTDNGREFTNRISDDHASSFTTIAVAKRRADHKLIPLGQKNWQADVESSHRLIEDECWLHMMPGSMEECIQGVQKYQDHFNMHRYNSYKKGSPLEMLRRSKSNIPEKVLLCPVIEVEQCMTRRVLNDHAKWFEKARATGFYERIRFSMRIPFRLPELPKKIFRHGSIRRRYKVK